MNLIKLNCLNCGAGLTVDQSFNLAYCEFCNSVFLIKHDSTSAQMHNPRDFDIRAGTLVKYTGAGRRPVIPYNVRHIGNHAFCGLDIESVTIPSSVKSIGQYAFTDCVSLTEIVIPASVQSIGNRAFWRCFKLSRVTIEGKLKLGDDVFLGAPFWDYLVMKIHKAEQEERRRQGLCPHCGGKYGLFGKCKICGRKKD